MTAPHELTTAILEAWPLEQWADSTVVVGASGGADSTALVHALWEIRPDPTRLVLAHYNHALRGQASEGDAAFVHALADQLGVKIASQASDESQTLDRSENGLRLLRYGFFRKVIEGLEVPWLALGHHADDQLETFLHRLLRGSGPSGLAGIQPRRLIGQRTVLIRPLLSVRRSVILDYLAKRGLSYRIDQSNASPAYTRNRIRHELIPYLKSFAGSESVDDRLLQSIEGIAAEHRIIQQRAEQWLERTGYGADDAVDDPQQSRGLQALSSLVIPLALCRNEPWVVVREGLVQIWHNMQWPLREMNARHWQRLAKLIEVGSQSPHPKRIDLPGRIRASTRKRNLHLERVS